MLRKRCFSLREAFSTSCFRSYSSVPLKWGQEGFSARFAHLKNDKIAEQKGKFVSLPPLYAERNLAKGLTFADCASFLLTEERVALWEEMNKANGSFLEQQPLNGTCLSGPNGVGKSSLLHMLASCAHVNDWIVLYIVSLFHSTIFFR